jgi:hypothetical protein
MAAHADEIVRGLHDKYNAAVPLPGLRLGNIPKPEAGLPAIRPRDQGPRTTPVTFMDASGKPWQTVIPANDQGGIADMTSCLPVPGMTQKIAFKPDTKRGNDQPPRVE